MKKLSEIAEEVIETWASAGCIPVPDKISAAPLMTYAMDLAKQVQQGTLDLDDIYKFIKEKLRDQDSRNKSYLWSLHSISRDIYAWKQTRDKSRIKHPTPTGWKNYVNDRGEAVVWDYDTGRVMVIPGAVTTQEVEQQPNEFPSIRYRPIAPNETIVKRHNRVGYERSFYMDTDYLTDEERRSLEDLARDTAD